ncbi:MAG: TetR/AcrR family transcriptional regulator [Phycisphaeraceae bacterium]|nr:TetR/AcrR family transcriptional regulator [Phycisphaeraceae bacterium]
MAKHVAHNGTKHAPKPGRDNQRRRTRKDLLAAAAKLMKSGRTPDMDEVAAEAMVSRATAYRYFPTIEALLFEAMVDEAVPDGAALFAEDRSTDVVSRVDRAEAALHEVCYRYEGPLRAMLAASLERGSLEGRHEATEVPVRQNRRSALIAAALEPAKAAMSEARYTRLCAALALVFGTESMIVFQDVLRMEAKEARRVKRWMIESLVHAAMSR